MKRLFLIAFVVSLAVAPMFAQAPNGWKMRGDRSMDAADPDAPGSNQFLSTGTGFHAINPMAAIYWNPANTMTGNYSVKGTFKLIKMTGRNEYYGLTLGGSDLGGPAQEYLYFEVSDDGTFLVKRRAGASAQTVVPKTENAAVKKVDASGMCTNALEMRVMADKVDFVVNGIVVKTLPKSGMAAKTDGIYGIRVNHLLEVQIDSLGVS